MGVNTYFLSGVVVGQRLIDGELLQCTILYLVASSVRWIKPVSLR